MRVGSFFLAGLAVASLAASAGATTSVYFTATSGGVQTQGAPGGILELRPGQGPWTIEMRVSTDKRLQTWGLDLAGGAGISASNSVANVATWPGANGGTPGSAAALLVGAGFIDLDTTPAAAGDHQLLSFTLGNAAGGAITGIVNINEWVDFDAGDYDPQTRFGAGPFGPGSLGLTTGTLISIVPEPTTLGLLLVGGVALARRRRSR